MPVIRRRLKTAADSYQKVPLSGLTCSQKPTTNEGGENGG
jgi:hypothetical protein